MGRRIYTDDDDVSYPVNLDALSMIQAGYVSGITIVNKSGRNPDISSASGIETVWNSGGMYTGFPRGAPEEFQVVLSDPADVGGRLFFSYLASDQSTNYTIGEV